MDAHAAITGDPIKLFDGCELRQPTLMDIRKEIGFDNYYLYLGLMSYDEEFETLLTVPVFIHALSFWVIGDLHEDVDNKCIWIIRDGKLSSGITKEIYSDIKEEILEINGRGHKKAKKAESITFANKYAEEAYKASLKIKEEIEEQEESNTDSNLTIHNMISKIDVYHPSINILNVWGLTVLQLLSRFNELVFKHQYQATVQKWAVWGKDPLEPSLWYKDYNNTGENNGI